MAKLINIGVFTSKGGVGKTTSSIALAGLLAEAGKRVVVVDLDPHGSMTSYFGYDPDSLEHSNYDLFLHKGRIRNIRKRCIKCCCFPAVWPLWIRWFRR